MYSKDIQNYINANLITINGYPNSAVLRRDWFQNSDEYNQILKETKWVNIIQPEIPIKNRILLIHNNITTFYKCEYCGSPTKFKTSINKVPRFCSKKCSYHSTLKLRQLNEKTKFESLKESTTLFSLNETKNYIEKQFNKNISIYERESIYDDLYHSINYYNIITDISFLAKMYCLYHNIEELPKCKQCNKTIHEIVDIKYGFRKFCSVSCQSIYNSSVRIDTYFKNTGFTHFQKNPSAVNKMKLYNLEKWGNEIPQQSEIVKEKSKHTKLMLYGDCGYNNFEQTKKTCLDKYGYEYYMSTNEFKQKSKETCLLKYDVENFAQSDLAVNGYKWYEYELPSGKIIKYQGYENKYIPILIKKYGENNVCFNKCDVPKIKYKLNENNHVYFPDFYVPCDNLIIEIKSKYTYYADLEKNLAKFKAVTDAGYNFKLKIYY